jgi:hypothetical protein
MQRKPERQIQDHADHGCRDAGERTGKRLVVAQSLDERRAETDPEKAGHKGAPGREQPTKDTGQHGGKRAWIAIGGKKAHKLDHHDQRSRRSFRHAEPVEHLARPQPSVGIDRLLRHVGEHRVGAAERDDRHLREEEADLREDARTADAVANHQHRQEPEREPQRGDA